MEIEPQSVKFQFDARYYKLGRLGSATKEVWWVLHGYGQLAQYFIQKFKVLADEGICVIAPEGLSRFYLQGNQGRVGASWMTRENRLTDIDNYIRYLNAIHQTEIGSEKIKTTLFGFSQGAATLTRWALNKHVAFDRMILWAGLFPPDIDFSLGVELLKGKQIIQVMGLRDEFINAERMVELTRLNEQLQISPTIVEFDGKHEIHESTLLKILKNQ